MNTDLAARIAKRIGLIPASHGSYMEVAPSTLRDVLDPALIDKIADEAAKEALSDRGGEK